MELPISIESALDNSFVATLLRPTSLLLSVVLIVVATYLPSLLGGKKGIKGQPNPVIGSVSDRDFHDALNRGYKEHKKGSLFTIPMIHHPMTIVPDKFLDEIKNQPENILSFQKQVTARFLGKYTGLGVNDTLVQSVKVDLTKNIPNIMKELADEVHYSIKEHIGQCDDWTGYEMYDCMLHLVSLLSGRIFVGLPISRNKEWLHATVRYSIDGFVGAEKLWEYPTWSHGIMQYLIPEVRQVHQYLANGSRMLAPIIKERQKISPDSKNKPQDMIQWIMDNCEPSKRSDTYYITKTQMLISLVAIHTTTMTMAQVMFDLIAHPEYIDILREEIQQVRPDSNAEWTKQQIADLKKTDSFMKESQRFRPPGLVTMNRQVETNFKLSNGLVLEKGMHIGVAAASNALDPEYFNDPEKFDGLRFYKLRTDKPGNDSKYQFVTVGPDQLHWGAGLHACPGRFFATYEIKMLVARMIMDYDIRLAPHPALPAGERPFDVKIDIRVIPNPMAVIEFKRRKHN